MQDAPRCGGVTGTRSFGECGATLVEYALVLAILVIFCIGALRVLGDDVVETYDEAGGELPAAGNEPPPSSPGTTAPTIDADCVGETCTFRVTNPPAGVSYSWTTTPNIASGTGATFNFSSGSVPDYVVHLVLQPGNTTRTWSVTCTGSGGNRSCTVD